MDNNKGLYYCNNQGTIQCVQQMMDWTIVSPMLTVCNDYNLYAQIKQTIKELSNIFDTSFHHVRGHQDSKLL